MKRFIALCLVAFVVFGCALAELDDMSFDELIDTNRQIVCEIMSRPEWKETNVPSGEWVVGEDIPAGTYSVAAKSRMCIMTIWASREKDFSSLVGEYVIYEDEPFGKITLKDGYLVVFSQNVIFAPPKGIEF